MLLSKQQLQIFCEFYVEWNEPLLIRCFIIHNIAIISWNADRNIKQNTKWASYFGIKVQLGMHVLQKIIAVKTQARLNDQRVQYQYTGSLLTGFFHKIIAWHINWDLPGCNKRCRGCYSRWRCRCFTVRCATGSVKIKSLLLFSTVILCIRQTSRSLHWCSKKISNNKITQIINKNKYLKAKS